MNHSTGHSAAVQQPLVRHFYALAERFGRDPENESALGKQVNAFIESFVAFKQLVAPYEAGLKDALRAHAATERNLSDHSQALKSSDAERIAAQQQVLDLERNILVLRAAVEQHATGVTEAARLAEEAEVRAATLDGELTRLRLLFEETQAAQAHAEASLADILAVAEQASALAEEQRACLVQEAEAARDEAKRWATTCDVAATDRSECERRLAEMMRSLEAVHASKSSSPGKTRLCMRRSRITSLHSRPSGRICGIE